MLQWRQRARLLCFLNVLKNPPMEIGEIIGINLYATQRVLTVACLGFWGTLPNFFTGGKNNLIFGRIFDNIWNWRLTTPKLGEIWKT